MNTQYFIVIRGSQHGPFSIEELASKNITPETYVWHEGLENWTRAKDVPGLETLLYPRVEEITQPGNGAENASWYAMIDGVQQIGPHSADELINTGMSPETHVWKPGMSDWAPANEQAEFIAIYERRNKAVPPQQPANTTPPPNPASFNGQNNIGNPYGAQQYGSGNPYNQNPYNSQNPYGRNYASPPTNWLPWAIVATVVGVCFFLIGCIFGIIGIVHSNKANVFYALGRTEEGERINSNARTMTIIGLVLSCIGLFINIYFGYFNL